MMVCDGAELRTVIQQAPQIVARLSIGQGPSGPAGVDGADGTGDANYRHEQAIAAAVWDIAHGLNKYPSVTVIDSAGSECMGELKYLSVNALRLTFSAAFGGVAYLN